MDKKSIVKLNREHLKEIQEEIHLKKEKKIVIVDIDKILDKIYANLIKLTEKKFIKWLKSYESGLDQLFFKWSFLDGKELKLNFEILKKERE